jgi:dynein light chain 4
VKEHMDKKFGAPWNVVIGEYYAFEITYEVKNLLYVFLAGTKGVLLWKSA